MQDGQSDTSRALEARQSAVVKWLDLQCCSTDRARAHGASKEALLPVQESFVFEGHGEVQLNILLGDV